LTEIYLCRICACRNIKDGNAWTGTQQGECRISGHRDEAGQLIGRGTWSLPTPFGEPFRRMIDHGDIARRLCWMIGPGYVTQTCYTIVSRHGAAGQPLHGGPFYGRGAQYRWKDGQPRTEQVNIGWVLRDVSTAAGDGGLMLVPGSHKMRLPLPRPWISSCELPQVIHLQATAGAVIMYSGTTVHGVRSWRNPHAERRFVNTKATPTFSFGGDSVARL
jgi:hypothetical protein